MPGVFAHVKLWCVRGDVRIWDGAVGVDEVWLIFVGVGAMFYLAVQIILLVVVMLLHGVLGMFGFIL